jgi:hypothetical protein
LKNCALSPFIRYDYCKVALVRRKIFLSRVIENRPTPPERIVEIWLESLKVISYDFLF